MLFNLVLVGFMQFFYDLSNLGNFYSVHIIFFKLFLVGSCTLCMYTLCSLSIFFNIFIFNYISADENSNIDIGLYKYYYC